MKVKDTKKQRGRAASSTSLVSLCLSLNGYRETRQRSVGSLNFNANVERQLSPSLNAIPHKRMWFLSVHACKFHFRVATRRLRSTWTWRCLPWLLLLPCSLHASSIVWAEKATFLFSSPVSVETSCFEVNPLHSLFLIMETQGRLISVWKAKTDERSRTSWTVLRNHTEWE